MTAPVSSSIQGFPMLAATWERSDRNWLANSWVMSAGKPQSEGSAKHWSSHASSAFPAYACNPSITLLWLVAQIGRVESWWHVLNNWTHAQYLSSRCTGQVGTRAIELKMLHAKLFRQVARLACARVAWEGASHRNVRCQKICLQGPGLQQSPPYSKANNQIACADKKTERCPCFWSSSTVQREHSLRHLMTPTHYCGADRCTGLRQSVLCITAIHGGYCSKACCIQQKRFGAASSVESHTSVSLWHDTTGHRVQALICPSNETQDLATHPVRPLLYQVEFGRSDLKP